MLNKRGDTMEKIFLSDVTVKSAGLLKVNQAFCGELAVRKFALSYRLMVRYRLIPILL